MPISLLTRIRSTIAVASMHIYCCPTVCGRIHIIIRPACRYYSSNGAYKWVVFIQIRTHDYLGPCCATYLIRVTHLQRGWSVAAGLILDVIVIRLVCLAQPGGKSRGRKGRSMIVSPACLFLFDARRLYAFWSQFVWREQLDTSIQRADSFSGHRCEPDNKPCSSQAVIMRAARVSLTA